MLVWFPNKDDDPRFSGSHTPIRENTARRLTKEEFYRLKQSGKLRFAEMTRGSPGKYFFDNDRGMAGFIPKADKFVSHAFAEFVEDQLKDILHLDL